MRIVACSRCGSSEFIEKDGYRICQFCKAKYILDTEDLPISDRGISMNEDIVRLLKKCKEDPTHAKRYANLILDIDATNKEAQKYL